MKRYHLNITIPRELERRIKVAAVEDNITLSEIVEKAFGRYLEEREKKPKRKT